jgi:uncharacterized protein (TIGR03083 family)
MVSTADQVASLAGQADRVAVKIAEYLEELPFAEWSGPTGCADWSVAQLVAHLVLVEALLGGSINRGLRGDHGLPPQANGSLAGWRDHRAAEIRRLGELAPSELLALYRSGLETIRPALARLAAGEDHPGGGWHPWGVQSLPWFPGQWLVEVTLHDWDLRAERDPAAEVRADSFAGLGPQMRARMARCFQAQLAQGARGVVRIALDGPPAYAWLTRVAADGLELLDDGAAEPDATIATDPGRYALVQTGRRAPSAFAGTDRWRVSGDANLADQVVGAMRGY